MRLAPVFRPALLVALAGLLVAGCDTGEGPSLYDPNRQSLPDPVVSEVVTDDPIVLAGIDVITLRGSNFSATVSDNRVYFGEVPGEVLEASPTELRVRVPNTPREGIPVRVTVLGAARFSNTVTTSLVAAVAKVSDFGAAEEAFGMDSDAAGTLYVSLTAEAAPVGVVRIAPDGTRTTHFDAVNATWSDLAISSTGDVFGARGLRAVFGLPEGGSQQTFSVFPTGTSITALDFDAAGNLWAGGNNNSIFRIASDGTSTAFPFEGNVRALAVFGSAVYVAAVQDGTSRILRFPLDGSATPGAPEEILNVTAFNGRTARALAFTETGNLFIGTTDGEPTTEDRDPLLYLPQGGSASVLYPGVLKGAVQSLAYGPDTGLYMARAPSIATAVTPATPADLQRIETRQRGNL